MKYLLAFLLTALSCGAQTPGKAPCLKLTKVKISRHVLHQGGKMDMRLTFTGNPCSFLTAPRNPDEGAPTTVTAREMPTITFKPETDLEAKIVRTRYDRRLSPTTARKMTIDLELRSTGELRPRDWWNVQALMTTRMADSAGNISTEKVPVDFSFRAAPARKPGDFPDPPDALKTTGLIILGVALSPVLLVVGVICWVSGGCWD